MIPTSSNKAKIAASAAALFIAFPAAAEEIKVAASEPASTDETYRGSAECKPFYNKDHVRHMACELDQSVKRTEAANKRAAEADREAEAARKRGAEADGRAAQAVSEREAAETSDKCLDRLIGFVTSGAKAADTGETITKAYVNAKAPGGKVTPANACETAERIEKAGRRAEAPAPSVN